MVKQGYNNGFSLILGMSNQLLVNWEKKSTEHEKLYKSYLKKVDKNER